MDPISPEISIIIISYNTHELLKKCLEAVKIETKNTSFEIIVVDNASKDQSAEMVAENFPEVKLIRSPINLGFAAANNLAFKQSKGHYIVLLNSDAFIHPGCLKLALEKIQSSSDIGMGGAKLVGQDGSWQPSARLFPSFYTELLQLTGLADKYPHSKIFGCYNRTWDSSITSSETDWVPGAFAIIPRHVIQSVGFFDEKFFLYYEEVDLCKRIKNEGLKIWYWPDVIVTHLGGESAKKVPRVNFSSTSRQLELWSLRSQYLYFRKHYGYLYTGFLFAFQKFWHRLRILKNATHSKKQEESSTKIALLKQAWADTQGGTLSPPKPW